MEQMEQCCWIKGHNKTDQCRLRKDGQDALLKIVWFDILIDCNYVLIPWCAAETLVFNKHINAFGTGYCKQLLEILWIDNWETQLRQKKYELK